MVENFEIEKEGSEDLYHPIVYLKSLKDPFKEEVTLVKDFIIDAVNISDYNLYLLATGEEKHTRSIAENMAAFKKTLRSVSSVISNNVARKLLSLYPNIETTPVSPEEITSETSEINETSSGSSISENIKGGIKTPKELSSAFSALDIEYKWLVRKIETLSYSIRMNFLMVDEKQNVLIELAHRTKKLSEIISEINRACKVIASDITEKPIKTSIASDLSPTQTIDFILTLTINAANFNQILEVYVVLKKLFFDFKKRFNKNEEIFNIAFHAYASQNQEAEGVSIPPPPKPQSEEEEETATASISNPNCIIIFSESYNKVLSNFIKTAREPSILEKIHTDISEVGQNVLSPFSDVIKRRIKIRKAIKEIKKATVNVLVVIRQTTGKKDSLIEELSRWNKIIEAYNNLGKTLTVQINSTLSSQLSLSSADLYSKKIEESKSVDTRGYEQQKHMSVLMDAFQEPLPELPQIERLIDYIKTGKPWGMKTQKLF